MSPARILALDDNPENLKLVLHFLRARGYAVEGVTSTAAADEAIARERPDLVLVDVSLPQEDGLAWVQRARARPGAPPPFVALTAHSDADVRQRARAAGCDGFLTKPVPLRELEALVAACLAGSPPNFPES